METQCGVGRGCAIGTLDQNNKYGSKNMLHFGAKICSLKDLGGFCLLFAAFRNQNIQFAAFWS